MLLPKSNEFLTKTLFFTKKYQNLLKILQRNQVVTVHIMLVHFIYRVQTFSRFTWTRVLHNRQAQKVKLYFKNICVT
jgi:hypothetical protein